MNLGLRTLLFIAAIICFFIAIFSDVHWPDWIAIGLICSVGAILVAELGFDRQLGAGTTRT